MVFGLRRKGSKRVYTILGCFSVWLIYTAIFPQIIRFEGGKKVKKHFDINWETFETDERVSVCFKNVVPFSLLLKQDFKACQNIQDLLIVVHMHSSNYRQRNLFRKVLKKVKNEATIYDLKINAVFLLGLDNDQCIPSILLREMSVERDIFLGGFIDSNENQTLKSVTMIKWFSRQCQHTKLLLKLDGKMNPELSFSTAQFYNLIKYVKNRDILLMGSVTTLSPLSEKIRNFYFRVNESSSYPDSPQYLHLNYLLSRNVVISLLNAGADAINISAWKEDLFVTGVLANVAQIRPEHDERFLNQCSDLYCMFCDCFQGEQRKYNNARPYHSTQNLTTYTRTESFVLSGTIPAQETTTSSPENTISPAHTQEKLSINDLFESFDADEAIQFSSNLANFSINTVPTKTEASTGEYWKKTEKIISASRSLTENFSRTVDSLSSSISTLPFLLEKKNTEEKRQLVNGTMYHATLHEEHLSSQFSVTKYYSPVALENGIIMHESPGTNSASNNHLFYDGRSSDKAELNFSTIKNEMPAAIFGKKDPLSRLQTDKLSKKLEIAGVNNKSFPRHRVKVKVSVSAPKSKNTQSPEQSSENSLLKFKSDIRVTSFTSSVEAYETRIKSKPELRRRRKMKKIIIRARREKSSTITTPGEMKKSVKP